MDCYIVRVYRHVTRDDGKADEIAGLVERVGQRDSSKPFSSYQSLVSVLRGSGETDKPVLTDADDPVSETAARLRVVHPAKSG